MHRVRAGFMAAGSGRGHGISMASHEFRFLDWGADGMGALVIRAEQMRALEEAQVDRFAEELVIHFQAFAPAQCRAMGRDAVLHTTSIGLRNARDHGFLHRGAARFYVETMFMLGSQFDTDPQYRSVVRALFEAGEADETERADRLYESVMDYVDQTSGAQHEYERQALARAAHARFEHVLDLAHRPAADVVAVLHGVYPEKARYIGDSAIAALVEKGPAMAAERGTSWAVGVPLFAGLMFTFGHGCFADPQFPWISGSLVDAKSGDASAVLERLFRQFSIFLDRALTNLEAR